MVARGGREGKWRVTANGYGIYFGGAKNILELNSHMAKPCEYTKVHWIVHFKRMNLTE